MSNEMQPRLLNPNYNTLNRQSHYNSSQISSIQFGITIFEKKF
jgi:hypothetical protein